MELFSFSFCVDLKAGDLSIANRKCEFFNTKVGENAVTVFERKKLSSSQFRLDFEKKQEPRKA